MLLFIVYGMMLLISFTYYVVLLSLGNKNETTLLLNVENVDTIPPMQPFSIVANKGCTLTVDVAPYVNSGRSWSLSGVVDPKRLAQGIGVSCTQFVMTVNSPGQTELQWQIIQGGRSFSSTALLMVQG